MANVKEEKETKKFEIKVEEHDSFEDQVAIEYMKASTLCGKINKMFMGYKDYEGSRMDPDPTNGFPTITLIFNRLEHNPDEVYACTKNVNTGTRNSTLHRLRQYDYRLQTGDRYVMSEEGIAGLEKFMIKNGMTLTRDGRINWDKCLTTVSNPQQQNVYYQQPQQQYNMLRYLDINILVAEIKGRTDPNDSDIHYFYAVQMKRSIPVINVGYNQQINKDYMLEIRRLSTDRIDSLARSIGMAASTNGLDIIRATI